MLFIANLKVIYGAIDKIAHNIERMNKHCKYINSSRHINYKTTARLYNNNYSIENIVILLIIVIMSN